MVVKFYKTLFEPGEYVCWGKTAFDTGVRPIRWFGSDEQFFVINPLKDNRRDDNVTAFRNILIELDKTSLDEQKKFIEGSGIPYSTLVYSGGKSLHVIISLEMPLTTKADYKDLVSRIYSKLGGKEKIDTSTSNPSRFSRTPDATRDNGIKQSLLEVWERVPNAELLQWVGPPTPKSEKVEYVSTSKLITIRALSFIRYGADEGEWNSTLFTASCDLFRHGHTLEEVLNMCAGVTGHLDSKDRSTIRSAKRTVTGG